MSTAIPAPATAPVPLRSPLPSGLSGTRAVLVGGSSGIGLAAAVLLRSVGAGVVLVGRDPDRLKAAADRVRGAGRAQGAQDARPADAGAAGAAGATEAVGAVGDTEDAVLTVAGDGGDERVLAEAFDRAGRVDHLLVTAGGPGPFAPVTDLSAEDIEKAYNGRLRGTFAAARAAATRLPAGGSLTFSSGILVVRPRPGMTTLLSAAGAVESLTRALAVELAPARLRVNTLRFGRVDTPLLRSIPALDSDEAVAAAGASTPLGRFGTAEEAAASALFLMANNYVTGQVITVDGGETLS